MDIEQIVNHINKSDIPEQGRTYAYETSKPIVFENRDLFKEFGLQLLNNDTTLTKDECNLLINLIMQNPYYGLQLHSALGTIVDKLNNRLQHWHSTKYFHINRYWTMRYDLVGNVIVTNHFNNKEHLFQPIMFGDYIDHKATKNMIIKALENELTINIKNNEP